MSGPFDFRDMLGGAAASVTPDASLADGLKPSGHIDGLHAHLLTKQKGMPVLVNLLASYVCANANANNLCTAGLLALVIARLGQKAVRELSDDEGPVQRQHLIDELQAMLDAMRRGDA